MAFSNSFFDRGLVVKSSVFRAGGQRIESYLWLDLIRHVDEPLAS